jgi:O-antigen/teichoic acid export membrane protein
LLSASKLLLIPIYTRYLAPDQYGLLGTVNTINIILIMAMGFGIERAVAREYFDYEGNREDLKSYLVTIIAFTAALNVSIVIALGAIGFWAAEWSLTQLKIPFTPYVPLALAISSSTTFFALFMVVLQVRQMPQHYVSLQLLRFALIVGTTLLLLICFEMEAMAILWAELLGTAVTTIIIALFAHRWFLGGNSPRQGPLAMLIRPLKSIRLLVQLYDGKKLRHSFLYAFPLLIFELGGWVISGLDRIFLAKYRSLEEVGIYALGATLAQGLNVLTSSLQTAYLPFFFQIAKSHSESGKVFARTSSLYVLVVGLVCLFGILFSDEIIGIIAPSAYGNSGEVMQVLLLATFFWALYRLVVLPLLHLKETRYVLIFIGVSMIFSLVGNLWFIPLYGVAGAAWTNTVCYGILFSMAFWTAARRYPIRYPLFAFWGIITLVVFIGCLCPFESIYSKTFLFLFIMLLALYANFRRVGGGSL